MDFVSSIWAGVKGRESETAKGSTVGRAVQGPMTKREEGWIHMFTFLVA